MTTASPAPGSARCAAWLSLEADARQAARQACAQALERLAAPVDLALLFVSPAHQQEFDALGALVCDELGVERLIGCAGESIVGEGREIESGPALSLWLAHLPGAEIRVMHLKYERSREGGAIVGWPDDWPPQAPPAAMLAIGEPFSFPAELLLEQQSEDRPGLPIVGGMASGASRPGGNRLWLGRRVLDEGAVVASLHGPVKMRTVVSQGCRPIGEPFVVTRAERNVIHELGGRPALDRLQEVFQQLPTSEQRMVQRGLHLGRVVSEYQERFQQGDFLVRNVVAIDQQSGAIAIGDLVRPGQTVQFHVRDAQTADHELRQMLAAAADQAGELAGGLLFTCNGRGTRLFQAPHHDAGAVQQAFGALPLAGFFAAGEIGPVGGRNFLHGYTASLALFERGP